MPERASVIVCTHSRSGSLEHTVRSLLASVVEDDAFEIVVVDNASTDATAKVAGALMREFPGRPLRYVREEHLGKHRAQHMGARAALSSLLLYTDDDIEVSPEWVQAFIDAFDAHPEMEAAGGPVRPHWEDDPPAWLLEYMSRDEYSVRGGECCGPLAIMDRGDEFLLGSDGYFFGNNMAIRYDALKRSRGFRPGLVGGEAVGSSEWGIVEAMQKAGAMIGYVPAAIVWHTVSRERTQPAYIEGWSHGPAGEMFDRWHGRGRAPSALLAELWRILSTYSVTWLRAALSPSRPDPETVRIRVRARNGLCELRYLWWMLARSDVKALLDLESFGP